MHYILFQKSNFKIQEFISVANLHFTVAEIHTYYVEDLPYSEWNSKCIFDVTLWITFDAFYAKRNYFMMTFAHVPLKNM